MTTTMTPPASHTPDLDEQLSLAVAAFRDRFGRPPTVAAAAPGRVNLIGEHTDYNDGFVMPMAIDRRTILVAARSAPEERSDEGAGAGMVPVARIISTEVEGEAVFNLTADLAQGPPAWSNYLRGVAAGYLARGLKPVAFDALLSSTVPTGGGLSSSASIEVAFATLLEALHPDFSPLDPVDKALLCQRAEHEFAGMPCGIMDQFISTMGHRDHALLIDCRSREVEQVPLSDPSVSVLIVNSNVKHELTGGEYAQRRAQCEAAARTLGVAALRDATMSDLDAARDKMDEVTYRRARHVITENERTLAAAAAMRRGDWRAMGRLMAMSHASLRDDFEVSTPELDKLVELAATPLLSGSEGAGNSVIGSRMTGGGFGGCTVTLVRTDALAQVSERIAEGYRRATGTDATLFVTRPAQGAMVLKSEN